MAESPTVLQEIERDTSFIQQNALWLLGIAPLIYACFRIIVVSGGNSESLKALVQDLDVKALVLATLLPFLTTALFWVFIFASTLSRLNTNKRGLFLVSIIALPMIYYTMPLAYLLANITALVVFLIITILSGLTRRRPFIGNALAVGVALAGIAFFVLAPFSLAGMWLPKERITIGEDAVVGYILSDDGNWTKYMDNQNKVHIVPSTHLVQRETMNDNPVWYNDSLSALLD